MAPALCQRVFLPPTTRPAFFGNFGKCWDCALFQVIAACPSPRMGH
jgi:hypothetical protein